MQSRILTLILSLISIPALAHAQAIRTVAGGGPRNLPALQVGLAQPSGLALDAAGNVYVSLAQWNQIWKIDPKGMVNLFAGNGSFQQGADSVPATASTLCQPQGLAFDRAGNLYVADAGHNRIRKVSVSGIITTVAGSGPAGFAGDGGSASAALLNNPVAIAVDPSNNLYIVDQANERVRLVNQAGVISTVAGTGTAAFSGDNGSAAMASLNRPSGIAVDSSSAVYIADSLNYRIRKILPNGNIVTAAGTGDAGSGGNGGPALTARFDSLTSLALDQFNNLYIAEAYGVRVLVAASGNLAGLAGIGPGFSGDNGPPGAAAFRNLAAVALDSSGAVLYLADAGNSRIRKMTASQISTFAGNGTLGYGGNGGPATDASLLTPTALALDNTGSLAFADSGSSSIRKLSPAAGTLTTPVGVGAPGTTPDGGASGGPVSNPIALAYDAAQNLYFAEGNRIRKVSGGVYSTVANTANAAGFSGDGGPATAAQLSFPSGLAIARNGDIYVADAQNHRVRLIGAQTGVITTVAGTGIASSTGDNGPAASATLNFPSALALDGAGNLFVSEMLGNRVRKIALATGAITTLAGGGTNPADNVPAATALLSAPFSIFADQSSNLFIADQGSSRVRKVTASTSLISTVAGNGAYDFSGDGGPATLAAVNPLGITVDPSQTLYIADSSGRIRTVPVAACFFTLSTPVITAGNLASTGSIAVTATDPACPYAVASSSPFVTITSGASGTGSGTVTFSVSADPGGARSATVSIGGASAALTQAGLAPKQNIGIFQPGTPVWALDSNGNGLFDPTDRVFTFAGSPGAIAVTGDWNGDGKTKVGYYQNGFWVLDYNGNGLYDGVGPAGDKFYGFGSSDPAYIPVVGDWNGDGRTKIGLYYKGFWILDTNGNGVLDTEDRVYGFGGKSATEVPVLGDWNGDKRTKIGVYYQGLWILDYDGDGVFTVADKNYQSFPYAVGDKPVVGDWNGDGKTKIGVYRNGFWILDYNGNGAYDGSLTDKFYAFGGNVGEIPIVADWNGDGRSKIGVFHNGFWALDFNGNGFFDIGDPAGDRFIPFGAGAGTQPIIGRW